MARDDPHFRLRLPFDLKARIESAAVDNSRSINGEIVERLDWSFDRAAAEFTALHRQIQRLEAQIEMLTDETADLRERGRELQSRLGDERFVKMEMHRLEGERAALQSDIAELKSVKEKIDARLSEQNYLAETATKLANTAVDSLEGNNRDLERTLRQERYMLSQIKLMRFLLDAVAKNEGALDPAIFGAIQILGETPGAITTSGETLRSLLEGAIRSIEQLDEEDRPSDPFG